MKSLILKSNIQLNLFSLDNLGSIYRVSPPKKVPVRFFKKGWVIFKQNLRVCQGENALYVKQKKFLRHP